MRWPACPHLRAHFVTAHYISSTRPSYTKSKWDCDRFFVLHSVGMVLEPRRRGVRVICSPWCRDGLRAPPMRHAGFYIDAPRCPSAPLSALPASFFDAPRHPSVPFSALPAARAKAFRKVGNFPKRCGIPRWISIIDYPSMLFCKGCCKPPFDCYSAVKRLLERLPRLTQRLPRLTSLAAFTNDEGKTSWPIQLLMLTSALPAAFALTLAPRAFSSSATRTLRSRTRTPALPAALARRLAPPAPSPRSSRTSFKGTSGRRVAAPGAQAGCLGRCPAIICATGSLRAWRR